MAAAARRCGPCTLCCKVLTITELGKPGGQRCPNQTGAGCSIHGRHPQSCSDFACQWLLVPDIPHRYRPDLCKVILATDGTGERLFAHCDPANPFAWRREPIYSMLLRKAQTSWGQGLIVMARAGRRVWLLTPKGEQDLGEIHPEWPVSIVPLSDGTARVTISPPPVPTGGADRGAA